MKLNANEYYLILLDAICVFFTASRIYISIHLFACLCFFHVLFMFEFRKNANCPILVTIATLDCNAFDSNGSIY
jgi:hypothetical protein